MLNRKWWAGAHPTIWIGALLFTLGSANAVGEEPHLVISAYPIRQVIAPGGKALVYIEQRNSGPESLRIGQVNGALTHAERDYIIRIHDERGGVPRLTQAGRDFFEPTLPTFGSAQVSSINAGQIRRETVSLDALYVLSPGRTYVVFFQLKAQVPNLPEPVNSNRITVSVR